MNNSNQIVCIVFDIHGVVLEELFGEVVKNESIINLILDLKKNYKIVALSNATFTSINLWNKKANLELLFDELYFSDKTGFKKPDERAFRHLLSDLKIEAKNVLFIDDSLSNVSVAKSLGINSVLFINTEQLIKSLSQFTIV